MQPNLQVWLDDLADAEAEVGRAAAMKSASIALDVLVIQVMEDRFRRLQESCTVVAESASCWFFQEPDGWVPVDWSEHREGRLVGILDQPEVRDSRSRPATRQLPGRAIMVEDELGDRHLLEERRLDFNKSSLSSDRPLDPEMLLV